MSRKAITRRSVVPLAHKRSTNARGRRIVSMPGVPETVIAQGNTKSSGKKPRILVIDSARARSPLLTQFYEHISRPGSPFSVITDTHVNTPAREIIASRYGNEIPDYIYWGFTKGTSLFRSADFINRHNIGVIVDMGDMEYFYARHQNLSLLRTVRFIIARWPRTAGYDYMAKLIRLRDGTEFLRDASIVNVPWGVNPQNYKSNHMNRPRDIDVALICSYKNKHYHTNRRRAMSAIRRMTGIKSITNNVYGQAYIDALYRSKIFIVEGSRRNFLVQKYLEAPMCGAMLMGEIPETGKNIFKHGESIVSVDNYDKLEAGIRHYLEHPDERDQVAGTARKRVLERYHINKVTGEFTTAILNDFGNDSSQLTRKRPRKNIVRMNRIPRKVTRHA